MKKTNLIWIMTLLLLVCSVGVNAEAFNVNDLVLTDETLSGSFGCLQWFNNGSNLFLMGYSDEIMYIYNAETPYSLNNMVLNNSKSILSLTGSLAVLSCYVVDETEVYFYDHVDTGIKHLSFSSSYDLDSVSNTNEYYDFDTNYYYPANIWLSDNGVNFVYPQKEYERVCYGVLSTPYNITSYSQSSCYSLSGTGSGLYGFSFYNEGNNYLVLTASNDVVYQYNLGTPYAISTSSYSGNSIGSFPYYGLYFDNMDLGTNLYTKTSMSGSSIKRFSFISLEVTAKDFETESDISDFNVVAYNENVSINGTASGTDLYLALPNAGEYYVVVDKDGFASSTYIITYNNTDLELDAYLINSTSGETTVFTTKNIISEAILPDVTCSMYNLKNTEWELINSKNSDITGRAPFTYLDGYQFKFIFSKSGYETKTVLLNPSFDSYTVKMTPDTTPADDYNIGAWYLDLNNSGLFYDNQINNFTASIVSGIGSINYYNLTITNHNGTSETVNCSNAYGCVDSFSLNITDAGFNSFITLEYDIAENGNEPKHFKNVYRILDAYNDNTFLSWKDLTDAEVGDLEGAFIVLIISIIMVGVVSIASTFAGVPAITPSSIVLTVTTFLFAYVGFIPYYGAYIIGLGTLLIVIFGKGAI